MEELERPKRKWATCIHAYKKPRRQVGCSIDDEQCTKLLQEHCLLYER